MGQNVHGSKAGALLDGRDLTRYTTDFNFATDIDVAEQTCLMADGGAKEYLYGNTGASAGLDGRLAKSKVVLEREMDAVRGREEGGKLLLLAPAGFAPGRPAMIFQTLKERLAVRGGTGSVNGTGMSFIADGVARVASMLLAPRVPKGAVVARDEVQVLTFNNVPATQEFVLRAAGTTQSFAFTPNTGDAALKAGIEGLAAYVGRTVTISGALTGTTTKSGAKTITFDGAVNVAALEVVQGQVDNVSGSGSTVSINGVAVNFAVADPKADFQTRYRASDVKRAGAVVAGTFTKAVAGTITAYTLSGAGTPIINGTYTATAAASNPAANTALYTNPSGVNAYIFDKAGVYAWFYAGSLNEGGYYESQNYPSIAAAIAAGPFANLVVGFAGAAPVPTGAVTAQSGGNSASVNITLTYPASAGSVGAVNVVGAGYTGTTTPPGAATSIVGATTQEGGTFSGLNLITAPTTFPAVKTADAATATGATIDLHATFVSSGALSVPVLLEHSANGTTAWATLATFVPISDATNRAQLAQRIVLPSGTIVQPWLRVRVPTLTGSAALGVALARKPS